MGKIGKLSRLVLPTFAGYKVLSVSVLNDTRCIFGKYVFLFSLLSEQCFDELCIDWMQTHRPNSL